MGENVVYLSPGMEKLQTSSQRHALGVRGILTTGEVFRYSFADGAVGAGKLLQNKVPVADDDMDVVVAAAAAAGAKSISVTTVSAILADEYKDGVLYVNDGPGEGHKYRLGSHLAAGATSTLVLNLAEGEEVVIALTTADSLVGLKWPRYKDVIIAPTTITGTPVGVTPTNIADNNYFWAQTWGDAAVWIDGTVVLGMGVMQSVTNAGQVVAYTAGGDDAPLVGWVENPIAVTTDYSHVYLTISP